MAGYDNVSSSSAATASSLNWAHNNIAGTAVYVWISGWDGAGRTVSVTHNAIAMTQIADSGVSHGNDRVWLFRRVGIAVASQTVAATVTGGSMHLFGIAISVTSAHQSDFSTPVTSVSSGNGTTGTLAVTGTASGLLLDAIVTGATNTHTATGAAGHTERADLSLAQGEAAAGGTTVADGSSQTLSWTISSSSGWAMAAVNVKDASAAGGIGRQMHAHHGG